MWCFSEWYSIISGSGSHYVLLKLQKGTLLWWNWFTYSNGVTTEAFGQWASIVHSLKKYMAVVWTVSNMYQASAIPSVSVIRARSRITLPSYKALYLFSDRHIYPIRHAQLLLPPGGNTLTHTHTNMQYTNLVSLRFFSGKFLLEKISNVMIMIH